MILSIISWLYVAVCTVLSFIDLLGLIMTESNLYMLILIKQSSYMIGCAAVFPNWVSIVWNSPCWLNKHWSFSLEDEAAFLPRTVVF